MYRYALILAALGYGCLKATGALGADLSQQESTRMAVELGTKMGELTVSPTSLDFETGKLYKLVLENPSPAKHYFSALRFAAAIYRDPWAVENYLLEVDKPVVLPAGKKIRFLLTADDVIQAWWVSALSMKKDAIPGFINEIWVKIEEPGIYRGQCTEPCGKDHGFMPIVVEAKPEDKYKQWVAAYKAEQQTQPAAVTTPSQ